jgi:hypothetical protein
MFVDLFAAQDLDASAVLERFPVLKEPFVDSNEDPSFSNIVQRLRHVQDEMPGLISFKNRQ